MIIIEFTGDRVKLLEMGQRGGKVKINNFSAKNTAGLSDQDISAAISELFKELNIKTKVPLTVCIPRSLVTVRTLRLPSTDEAELKDMVALQAGKQLPYPADELIWDFKIVEKRADGYSDVFLSIIHRNAIDRFIGILKEAGLEAGSILLNSEALMGWYLLASGFYEKEEPSPQARAVINLDTACADIVAGRGNTLEFSRSFSTKNDFEEISDEISKTFYSYEKENAKEISSIALTGIEEKAAALKPLLEAVYGTVSIEFIHPLRIMDMDYREGSSAYFDAAKETSFACLLGVAYNGYDITMDFLPPGLKAKIAAKKKNRILFKSFTLLTAIALLFLGVVFKRFLDLRRELNVINSKAAETEPKVANLKRISRNIDIIKRHMDMKGSSVDIIREIYKIVPQGVSIAVMDFEFENSLTLRGVAGDLSSVFKFTSDLEKSPYFEKCQIKYAQKRTVKSKEFVDFELNCRISP